MTSKFLIALLVSCASVTACAQAPSEEATAKADEAAASAPTAVSKAAGYPPGTPEAAVQQAISELNPNASVEEIGAAPFPGFRQAIVGGQVIYVSDDGRYLMQGTLFDIQNKKVVGEESLAKVRHALLESVPASDRIVFAPANPKYTVTVFTDVECGYCRKMHNEMAEYHKQGIAVEYVAFPRMGLASEDFKKMEAVWCSNDRNKALTDAKNDRKVASATCKNPVAMQYALGQRMGLTGTPMVLAEDGTQLGGYVPPEALRAALDENAGEAAPATTEGAPATASAGT